MNENIPNPIWLVAPEADDLERRPDLIEQLYGIFRKLGLRSTLRGLRMCLLYDAVRRVQVTALLALGSGPMDRVRTTDLFFLGVLKALPGTYLRLFRLLI